MLYWIKLEEPLGTARKQSQIYLGYADDDVKLWRRVVAHQRGRGAAFTRAAVERGIPVRCIGIMDGTRDDERRIKNRKNHRREFETSKRRGLIRFPTWLSSQL